MIRAGLDNFFCDIFAFRGSGEIKFKFKMFLLEGNNRRQNFFIKDGNCIAPPNVSLTKFVPYTVLEFAADVSVVGKITLPSDYLKTKIAKKLATVTDKEVNDVIENLRTRAAVKNDVDRVGKDGDQLWIDFDGFDQKGKAIDRADGHDYPLVLGSNTFIPGFETELVNKKAGDKVEFTLTFPKDYGVSSL